MDALALYGPAATVLVGLLALLGTRWLARAQTKAAENEERLSRYEGWDRLIANLTADNELARAERDAARAERDALRVEFEQLKRTQKEP